MEVLVDKVRYVLTDFSGKIVTKREVSYENYLTNDHVTEAILDNVRDLVKEYFLNSKKILGIGIAITGLIDNTEAIVHYSSNLQLRELPLKANIEEQVDIPVYLANDANAGALGIKWYSQSVDSLPPNIVYITYNEFSDYLGLGIIIHDVLYSGAAGTAGEVFDPLPNINDAGKRAMQRNNSNSPLKQWLRAGKHIPLSDVFYYAREDDFIARHIVDTIVQFMAYQLMLINGFINPDLIVLGGDIAMGQDLILNPLINELQKRNKEFLEIDYNIPRIMFSEYGNYSVAMGANAVIIRKVLG